MCLKDNLTIGTQYQPGLGQVSFIVVTNGVKDLSWQKVLIRYQLQSSWLRHRNEREQRPK